MSNSIIRQKRACALLDISSFTKVSASVEGGEIKDAEGGRERRGEEGTGPLLQDQSSVEK